MIYTLQYFITTDIPALCSVCLPWRQIYPLYVRCGCHGDGLHSRVCMTADVTPTPYITTYQTYPQVLRGRGGRGEREEGRGEGGGERRGERGRRGEREDERGEGRERRGRREEGRGDGGGKRRGRKSRGRRGEQSLHKIPRHNYDTCELRPLKANKAKNEPQKPLF